MSAVDTTTTVTASDHPTTTTVDGELMLLNTETGEVLYIAECDAEVENYANDNGYTDAPFDIIEENEAF